ncbi:TPA: hypothetical protein VDV27_005218 [Pseudomonas aeruginosa]|nr:hypothetical protein [Pseudomonas aeruginosa]
MANATVKQLNTLAAALPGVIAKLDAELATAQKRMAQLKRAGLVYATEHWREGRYLYLVHPQHDGERKREYVGTDPKKIKAAQDAIARARDYDAPATTTRWPSARARSRRPCTKAASAWRRPSITCRASANGDAWPRSTARACHQRGRWPAW